MRGMTRPKHHELILCDISIHMPHAGHDTQRLDFVKLVIISIHMPHAGHDVFQRWYLV